MSIPSSPSFQRQHEDDPDARPPNRHLPNSFRMEIIDLSEEFFQQELKKVPPVRGGKFVVMRDEAKKVQYFVLSPIEQSVYHANIVERFCHLERFNINGFYLEKSHYFVINDANWSVEGGGHWKYSKTDKELSLYDSSQAYGACILEDLKKRLIKLTTRKGWNIIVE